MSIQSLSEVEKVVQLLLSSAGFQVDCFLEKDMLCAVSSKGNTRILIGFFEDSEEHEFFLNDEESEFVTNITRD